MALNMKFLIPALLGVSSLQANPIRTLYHTLDPVSVSQMLSFYALYPESVEGKKALSRAQALLGNQEIGFVYPLLNHQGLFSEEELQQIETLASHLPNRKLRGYGATTEEEVWGYRSEEIDLGKALILSQLGQEAEARSYSAKLDLMALQILARLPKEATQEDKIREINYFIFDEMHFRFPPQSVYAENIDLYTFLPSVMDNHLGVCLGVTALYLAIAQRLDLPLEIVTPPGHIYLRLRKGENVINIETTARGINLPSETYLSVQTRKLQERTLKEVIGMTHFNQASIYLHTGEFQKAKQAYLKAQAYMKEDPLLMELLGCCYLLTGEKEKGEELLSAMKDIVPEDALVKSALAEDYLSGNVNLEGIAAMFMHVDETRDSILKKQKRLLEILSDCPCFRDGIQQLATGWIQLNRTKEAIAALEKHHAIDSQDPVVEYYLAVLYGQRNDYKSSWFYLKNALRIAEKHDCYPKALRDLKRLLTLHCPE